MTKPEEAPPPPVAEGAAADPVAPRIGILFVHGIGQQRRGDTLTRFGDPLVHWLTQVFPDTHIARASFASEGHTTRPSTAELNLRDRQNSIDVRWITAEGFWGDAVITPSFTDMLRWALQVLPWTALTHFDRIVRRSWTSASALEVLDSIVLGAAGTATMIVTLVLVLLLVPVVGVALVLVLFLGLMPIPALRSFSAAVQRVLSGTVGDSMILLASPVQRAAIVDRVHDAYRWLVRMRCDEVVIVAHSQGAAIAHEMLRSRDCSKVGLFVSLGSGLRKLKEIESVMEEGSPILWFASLSSTALVITIYMLLRFVGLAALPLMAGVLVLGLVWGMLTRQGWTFVDRPVMWIVRKIHKPPEGLLGCMWEFYVGMMTYFVTTIVTGVAYLVGAWYLGRVFVPAGAPWYVTALVVLTALLVVVTMVLLSTWRGVLTPLQPRRAIERTEVPANYRLPNVRRWVDVFAMSDPVPNGPLAEGLFKEGEIFESVEVENRSSFLVDHTSYWLNFEEVVSKIGHELLRLGGLDQAARTELNDERLRQLSQRRRHRVRALKRARFVVGIAALGVAIAHWGVLVHYGMRIRPSLLEVAQAVPLVGAWIVTAIRQDVAGTALAGILVVVAGALCYVVVASSWSAWDRRASRSFARAKPDQDVFAKPLFYASLVLVAVASLFLVLKAIVAAVLGSDWS
jgi:hypothetical protein